MKTKKNSGQKISEIYSYIKVNKRNNWNKSEKVDINKMNYKKSNENISIYKEEKKAIKIDEQKISHCHSQKIALCLRVSVYKNGHSHSPLNSEALKQSEGRLNSSEAALNPL